jgi:hypothetical protein
MQPRRNLSNPGLYRQRSRLGVVLLVLALLWVQSLGLIHHVVHAPGLHGPGLHASGVVQGASTAPDPGVKTGHFDSHHSGSTDCRLFDQLAHVDGAVSGALVQFAYPVLSGPLLALVAWRLVPLCTGFQARAPPLSR